MVIDPHTLQELRDLLLVLGLGGLIGLERERHRKEKTVIAGVRTYPLVSLAGYLAVVFALETQAWSIVSVGAAVIGGFGFLMFWARSKEGTVGLTSPISLFATYFVGVLIALDHRWEAIVAGLAIVVLLYTKESLHRLASVLTTQEMQGALYFLILAFILYPILPAEPVDPWNLVYLRQALLIVLAVSSISFLGFLALRFYGSHRGLPFTGFLGGLVNSEATTASLSERARAKPILAEPALTGIYLATATVFVRNLAIACIADPSLRLARILALPLLLFSALWVAWALPRLRKADPKGPALELESPFAFRPAIIFATLFTVVSVATLAITQYGLFGARGVYLAALGGLVSAGAVVASMALLVSNEGLSPNVAAVVGLLALLLSAANKPFIARAGGLPLYKHLIPPTAITILLGVAAIQSVRMGWI